MKQRVGIARAFALSPKLLLLDEPFGMLDSLTRWELQEVLMEVWSRTKVTAICVTHDVDEAILLADRVVMMTNGPQATIGKITDVKLPRPRTRKALLEHPDYYTYRQEVLDFLEEYEHGRPKPQSPKNHSSGVAHDTETDHHRRRYGNGPRTRTSVRSGADYEVTLFNAEPRGNYNRIMLSPVLSGDKTYAEIVTHTPEWYAQNGVNCRFGEKIAQIDREAKTVTAQNGDVLPYDKLMFGTGSNPFMIPLPGHDLEGVIAYRDLEDTERMMGLGAGNSCVVIGGGLLGLEAAAGMAARGVDVTVVHIMGHLMERQLDEAAGYLLRKALVDKGITVKCSANSKEILGKDGQVRALLLDDGTELPCDLLVMAVGIRPNVELAQGSGLGRGRGIHVDDQMLTSDADVLAVGECVEHDGAIFGLVAPLYDQAKVAAQTLLGEDS